MMRIGAALAMGAALFLERMFHLLDDALPSFHSVRMLPALGRSFRSFRNRPYCWGSDVPGQDSISAASEAIRKTVDFLDSTAF